MKIIAEPATEHETEIRDSLAAQASDPFYVRCHLLAFVQAKRAFTFSRDLCVTEAAATAASASEAFSEVLAGNFGAQCSVLPSALCQ